MANNDRNFDEINPRTYQFLFDLSDDDKRILAKFAKLSTIDEWDNMVKQALNREMPPYDLLDKIHLDYICDSWDWQPPFEFITYDKVLQISDNNKEKYQGLVNMVEVNTLALIESLKNDPRYAIA